MLQVPQPDDAAFAALLVGALFLLRFAVATRRLVRSGARAEGFVPADFRRATKPLAFGPDLEIDRRYAVRQLYVGLFFAALGLLIAAWLVAASVLGPFIVRGLAV